MFKRPLKNFRSVVDKKLDLKPSLFRISKIDANSKSRRQHFKHDWNRSEHSCYTQSSNLHLFLVTYLDPFQNTCVVLIDSLQACKSLLRGLLINLNSKQQCSPKFQSVLILYLNIIPVYYLFFINIHIKKKHTNLPLSYMHYIFTILCIF